MDKTTMIIIMLALYTSLITYIGYRYRHCKDSESFFLASRRLPSWLLAITFIASWWGGGSAIDLVDIAYRNGLSSFGVYGVAVMVSTFVLWLCAKYIRRSKGISQPEIIAQRYDERCALLLSIFIIIGMVLAAAVQVIVLGNFFHTFFTLSFTGGALLGTLVVVVYSTFGGFRGVVLTDFIQFIFFLFSALFLLLYNYTRSGGYEVMKAVADEKAFVGYTSIVHHIGGYIPYIITFGAAWIVQANTWQRISAARSPKAASRMMGICFFCFIPLYLMVSYTGMFALPLYEEVPQGGIVASQMLQLKSPIVSAFIFIGLCSAIMSTMDSLLNTGALSVTVDIYKKHIAPNKANRHYVNVGRISTLCIAAIALFLGIKVHSVLTVSYIASDFAVSGCVVPIIMGFVWTKGTANAAFYTLLFGLFFSSYNLMVTVIPTMPHLWKVESLTNSVVALIASSIVYFGTTFINRYKLRKTHSNRTT